MLRSPTFWFILILAIVIDGILIIAWRRRRGLSLRLRAVWQDSLNSPKNLYHRLKVRITRSRNPKLGARQHTSIKPPAWQASVLSTLTPKNLSEATFQRLIWQVAVLWF